MGPRDSGTSPLPRIHRIDARATDSPDPVAEILAALAYGERRAAERAEAGIGLAPDGRTRYTQTGVAERERKNLRLLEARLAELATPELQDRFRPFFDAFFDGTKPSDWTEIQTFHYVGDALVSDFADALLPLLDPVSAEVVRRAIGEREDQETFALDELKRLMEEDPRERERVAAYARRIAGEALTQTRRALNATRVLAALMGGENETEKRLVLDLLQRHRQRLDRLGIEPVE